MYTLPGRLGMRKSLRHLPIVVGVDDRQICWGKGLNSQARMYSCHGELLERRVRLSVKPDVVASAHELGDTVVDPPSLGVDLPNERADGGTERYDRHTRTGWVRTASTRHGDGFVHWPGSRAPAFYRLNSNGAAVHTSAQAAERAAVSELLERDAYMRWWYRFSSAEPAQPRDDRWGDIAAWLAGFGWQLRPYLLAGHGGVPVALCVALRHPAGEEADAVVIGASCTPTADACTACSSLVNAALEIVQLVESIELGSATPNFSLGSYERYFSHDGVFDVLDRLPRPAPAHHGCDGHLNRSHLHSVDAFAEECHFLNRRLTGARENWYFRQAFHADMLAYPLPGAPRRLDQPALRRASTAADLAPRDLPSIPHPLG
jgi:hypothetical protein